MSMIDKYNKPLYDALNFYKNEYANWDGYYQDESREAAESTGLKKLDAADEAKISKGYRDSFELKIGYVNDLINSQVISQIILDQDPELTKEEVEILLDIYGRFVDKLSAEMNFDQERLNSVNYNQDDISDEELDRLNDIGNDYKDSEEAYYVGLKIYNYAQNYISQKKENTL